MITSFNRNMSSSDNNSSVFVADNASSQSLTEKNVFWYTTVVLITLIMILATLGNLMVLAATLMERSLHQPDKYFVACLAFADLLIGVLFCPLELYNNVLDGGISSIYICRLYIAINIFSEAASINTLMLISFDRYLKMTKPLRYKMIMTTSKSLIMIIVIWLISVAYVVFAMFSDNGSSGIFIGPFGCIHENSIFFTFCAITAFFLPTIIILIFYACILLVAHRRRKASRNGGIGQTNQLGSKRSSFYQDLKNIRMMTIIVGAFIICWGPFFIGLMLKMYNPGSVVLWSQSLVARGLLRGILPIVNSICNPIIYACFDRSYRGAFKRILKRIMYC